MSRDFRDPDDSAEDQSELSFAAGGSRSAARQADPPRAEFFRAQKRPILPIVGLVGAVATVALFLWLGREEPPQAEGAPEAASPLAAGPPAEPLPDSAAPMGAPAPGAVAMGAPAPGAGAAVEAPALQAAAPPAEPDPLAPDPSVLGPSAALPPVAAAGAPVAEPAPAAAAAEADRPAAARPAAPPAARKTASAGRGGYSVQLLAARSEAQVGGAWQKLRSAHPELLASLSPSVSATERAGSGTFYRLRAGPLQDRAAADALCRQLSARHQSCFVVSPGS